MSFWLQVLQFQGRQACHQRQLMLDAWKDWAQTHKAAAAAKAAARDFYEQQLGLKTVAAWRAGGTCLVRERAVAAAAALHWRKSMLKRATKAWR